VEILFRLYSRNLPGAHDAAKSAGECCNLTLNSPQRAPSSVVFSLKIYQNVTSSTMTMWNIITIQRIYYDSKSNACVICFLKTYREEAFNLRRF
jgi:hypothetical protein